MPLFVSYWCLTPRVDSPVGGSVFQQKSAVVGELRLEFSYSILKDSKEDRRRKKEQQSGKGCAIKGMKLFVLFSRGWRHCKKWWW